MVTQRRGQWVLLAYRVPREPSTPRIAVWRKLRKLGVGHLVDGVVALPLDARNRERLEWIADEVLEANGQASVWLAEPSTTGQERDLAQQMADARAVEYRALVEAAKAATSLPAPQQRRVLARLRREHQRIRGRDYFPPPDADAARVALQRLGQSVPAVAP